MSKGAESLPHGDAFPAIEEAAAEWVVRHQQGLSKAEERAFRQWLTADPRHGAMFSEMTETSDVLDQLRDPALAQEPDSALGATAALPSARQRWTASRLMPALAAAAVLAVAGIFWLQRSDARAAFAESAVTEVGGRRELSLPDGSTVLLNTDSAVSIDFDATQRRVRLARGEAFFDVARDAARPFRVEIGAVSVRAVGTAFNIRCRADAVEVVVTEGRVSVDPSAAGSPASTRSPIASTTPEQSAGRQDPRLLEAGQIAKIVLGASTSLAPGAMRVDAIEAQRIEGLLAWQSGRLEFSDTPLSEVAAEFNRYNRHKLVIEDPSLAAQTFGGSFAPGGYESLVDVLKSFGIIAVRKDGETLLRRDK